MPFLIALIAGAIFGAGLTISGMSNPKKVLDFLDIAAIASGRWDPTLLMVFCGALPVMFAAYRLQGDKPWLASVFHIPNGRRIDPSLAAGSALFGIGWGLIGLCPGPAVIAPALASKAVLGQTVLFAGAMLLGVWLAVITRGLRPHSDETVTV